MTVRINARLDAELARKLAHLQARTGQSTTELIRASIESHFERVTGGAGPCVLLDEFVGCSSAGPDLSTTYEVALDASLERKLVKVDPLEHRSATAKRRRRGKE